MVVQLIRHYKAKANGDFCDRYLFQSLYAIPLSEEPVAKIYITTKPLYPQSYISTTLDLVRHLASCAHQAKGRFPNSHSGKDQARNGNIYSKPGNLDTLVDRFGIHKARITALRRQGRLYGVDGMEWWCSVAEHDLLCNSGCF